MVRKRSRKWIQSASRRMKKRGTVGSFGKYCQRLGFASVTDACIRKGLASRDPTIRKRANFARNVRKRK